MQIRTLKRWTTDPIILKKEGSRKIRPSRVRFTEADSDTTSSAAELECVSSLAALPHHWPETSRYQVLKGGKNLDPWLAVLIIEKGKNKGRCWKHWRLGIIKVLPLSLSKLHLETSAVFDLQRWHVFPLADITECNSCKSSFGSYVTSSPPHFFCLLVFFSTWYIVSDNTKNIHLRTPFSTCPSLPFCKRLTSV